MDERQTAAQVNASARSTMARMRMYGASLFDCVLPNHVAPQQVALYLQALHVAATTNRLANTDELKRGAREWLKIAIEMAVEDYPED